jgi:thiol-disulfide isomerase/thioredoxin
VNYSPEKLDPNKKNILFFHAQWCPACRTLEKDILSHEIPKNVQILKTDFHSYPELKKKYGVLTQHTLVEVDAEGNMLKKAL